MFNPSKWRDREEKSITNCIHSEIDEIISNRFKKCSLYRTEGHNRNKCPYGQVDG